MKYLISILLIVASSCSQNKTKENIVSVPKNSQISSLGSTNSLSEAEILTQARDQILRKIPLSAKYAERCWGMEEGRPNIRKACLLLWAIGKENSSLLEQVILDHIKDQFLVNLLLLRPKLISKLSYYQMLSCLDLVQSHSNWMKARLIQEWIQTSGNSLNREQVSIIIAKLFSHFDDTPLSLYETGKLIKKLDVSSWSRLLQNYCDLNSEGAQKLRCWRFMALFPSEIENDPQWRGLFFPFLPSFHHPDWILFTRNFPNQARKIQISFQQ